MDEKHLKKCSTSPVIKEMQIKITLRFHFISIRMANINETNDGSFWQGYDIGEHSFIACGSRNQCGGSSGRWELTYLKIQLYPYMQRLLLILP